jgi:hypothetical protein
VLLVPHSVARSNILKRDEIVAFQAMSLKKQDTFLPTPPIRLCFFPHSTRSSTAIRPIGLQVLATRVGQRSASPPFKQPSSTSTISLSTVSLSSLLNFVKPPGADPHAVVVWGRWSEMTTLTRSPAPAIKPPLSPAFPVTSSWPTRPVATASALGLSGSRAKSMWRRFIHEPK